MHGAAPGVYGGVPMNRRAPVLILACVIAGVVVGRGLLRAAPVAPAAPAPAASRPGLDLPVAIRPRPYLPPPAEPAREPEPDALPTETSFEALFGSLLEGRHGPDAGQPTRTSGLAPSATPEDLASRAAAYAEMARQTRYQDLVFTRRGADDQTIAYLADEWNESDDETLVARRHGSGVTDPDGNPAAFLGFWDLPEPYGTILLRVGGQETVLRFRAPPPASNLTDPSLPQ